MKPNRVIDVDAEGNVRAVEEAGVRETRERLKQLAWLLDSSIPIPGTRFTIGVDALVGLFPFIGDLVGVLLSSYILGEAARLGAPKSVLLRMSLNVGLEGLVGIVPFAGDVFDAAFKANQRNVRLLESWLEEPRRTRRSSRLFGAALVAAVVIFVTLLVAAVTLAFKWIAEAL
ncbi:MAG TPA: DUF4112 domain-containing protein [Burkholderiales bacterium]|nr:DUF4112 domain-containing protein [Burkholderiales bacterium]